MLGRDASVPGVSKHATATTTAERDQIVLGRALRELRSQVGLTQEQLADRLDAHPTFVGRVERGQRGVRWNTAMRFLRALGADLRQLADAMDEAERQAPSPKRLR
jgi:transcriptional regulator with XRE-family HTH domain